MIESRKDLHYYKTKDMAFYKRQNKKEKFMCYITHDPIYYITKYVHFLRMEEYFYNTSHSKISTLLYLWYFRRKNTLGNKLGFKIPKNTVGPGVMIYHHGELIINENAQIGANASFHGDNCIGNNGKDDFPPVIGDGLDLGIGAKIIGDVHLGNNVRVGANAVVIHSFEENDITLVGIPAKKIGR